MRDPLRNVSVRYKLAFTFVGVCLLAFGVGGFLVSRSAREALESEILTRLQFQSEAYATALEGHLRALGQRARDFASDGYIRSRFELRGAGGLLEGTQAERELRAHLSQNKLPLEPAFLNLALVGLEGEPPFVALPQDRGWIEGLPEGALAGRDWCSSLGARGGPEDHPVMVLATPLFSLGGERRIGTLLVEVHPGVWIAGALASMGQGTGASRSRPSLELIDGSGRRLLVPDVLTGDTPLLPTSELVRSGFGLVLREPAREREFGRAPERGVFVRRLPIALNGWSLETVLESREALAAVSGLQGRILIVGLVLTGAAALLLLFPMRFLARPLGRLRTAAQEIGAGDFSARVPVESSDEIGELSRAFNLMAQAVEERAHKLKQAARSLERGRNELRRERDRLNAVILSMRDGLLVLDADGRPELHNAAARPLLELARGGNLGLSPHRVCQGLGTTNGGSSGNAAAGLAESPCQSCLLDPAAPPRSCLVDLGPHVYEVHSTRLACEADGRAGRVLVTHDVTERVVQDEHEIHRERLAVLGEVAAVVAHELNNPLAAIRMFAQMLATKLPAGSELAEDVAVIERNTAACSRTIRELLDYATGASPEVGAVDVHATLQDVARFLRALRERKDVELQLELEAEDPLVVGDEVQIRQVFVNLVMNAVQAAGREGGRVRLSTRLDEGHLEVDVSDDGPGVPPAVAEQVFRPFFTTKPRGEGTGLGLSTARRITEIQGGGLELVEGRPGSTTFRVRLLRGRS